MDMIINDVISKSVKGLEINEILSSDKLYILFWLRANTYKETGFTVDFPCTLCDKDSSYEFNLDCIKTIDLDENYDPDKELTLPASGNIITIKQLTIGDSKGVSSFIKARKQSLSTFDEEILNIAAQITTIDGEQQNSLLAMYNYTSELNPSDYAYLSSYISHIDFGINNNIEVKCRKCGGDSLTGVTFRSEFFLPEYKF